MAMEQSVAETVINDANTKQPQLVDHFAKIIVHHDLTHAYLFSGEPGTGKLAVALQITMALFCQNQRAGRPCGHCNECMRIANRQHPDVVIVAAIDQRIKIEQVRALKAEFARSAVEGAQKVFILAGVDQMTMEAANGLLKGIEEPVGHVISFLLARNKELVLPTIVSRTQLVEFPALDAAVLTKQLAAVGVEPTDVHLIMTMTNNVQTVQEWLVDGWFMHLRQVVSQWFLQVNQKHPLAFTMVQTDIMPLIHNQTAKQITIDMLIAIWQDVLDLKFNVIDDAELAFPQLREALHQIAFRVPEAALLDIIELMLNNNHALAMNINFQTVLETTTLQVLAKLE